ncbi:MAG: NAD(P)H-dependent oxidoreductase [Ignavibacteriae bacterium]|jgi:NAD(P)H-dependent FMN reductase|nr:NADPH-dependent oxidoreductase [Ignavibacteriota bacterium]NOG99232.1 NAD(P)H-dependent oxidoreductase [Ignavibacteriota bacterium]
MKVNGMIRIVTILGSVRQNNNSAKALAIVNAELNKNPNVKIIGINPAELNLSLPGIKNNSGDAKWVNEQIKAADGVIIVSPEYHGSYSSVIKLVLDNLNFPALMKEKPVALVGVASGQIGAVKSIEHLRSVLSHMGAMVMPGPVSIANVDKVFNENGDCLNDLVLKRLVNLSENLLRFIKRSLLPSISFEQLSRN